MRVSLIAAAFVVLMAGPVSAQTADPIAPAREGRIECFGPNVAAKTCESISVYQFHEDGRIVSEGIVHIQNDPLVIAYGASTVTVRGNLVCSAVTRAEIDTMRFTIDGQPAPANVTNNLRNLFFDSLAGISELCARYTAEGEGVTIAMLADGVEVPEMADRMIWIRREDGYTIGAADASPT